MKKCEKDSNQPIVDRKKLITELCEKARKKMKAHHVLIRSFDFAENKLVLEGISSKKIEEKHPEYYSILDNDSIAGSVFTKNTTILAKDIWKNKEFIKYVKKQQSEKYKKFLYSFKSAIVVPLLLENKPVGTLAAVRTKNQDTTHYSNKDKNIIESFTNEAIFALHESWLWEAITWSSEGESTISNLISNVEREGKQKTGASEVQVRLLNWEGKFLLPSPKGIPNPVLLVICELCEHNISACSQCKVSEDKNMQPSLINNYNTSYSSLQFKELAKTKNRFLKELLNSLILCKEKVKKSNSDKNIKRFFDTQYKHVINIWSENTSVTKKRFSLPIDKLTNRNESLRILTNQIAVLDELSTAWNLYVESLDEWVSELVVPIHHGHRKLGVMSAYISKEDREFSKDRKFTNFDVIVLQALANRVAYTIMEHEHALIEKILEFGHNITITHDHSELEEKLIEEMKSEAAYFQKHGEGQEELEDICFLLRACHPPIQAAKLLEGDFGSQFKPLRRGNAGKLEKELADLPIRERGLGYKAIKTLDGLKKKKYPAFIICDNVADPIREASDEIYDLGIKSAVCIPLAIEQNVYGLLYIYSKSMRYFTGIEKEAFLLLAQQATTLLKLSPPGSMEKYNSFLIKIASKKLDNQSECFENIHNVLTDNKFEGRTVRAAVSGIKNIVMRLTSAIELPRTISERYVQFWTEEDLLYQDKEYRDHFFHIFHTFLLGLEILKKMDKIKNVASLNADDLPFCINKRFLKKWFLVSIWHDLTYTAEKGADGLKCYIKNKFDIDIDLKAHWGVLLGKNENVKAIKDMINQFEELSGYEDKNSILSAWFNNQLIARGDHAILAALVLKKEYNKESMIDDINECALSIAIHNLPKSYLGENNDINENIGCLNIEDFPLAYLLTLCDAAQEWDRSNKRDSNVRTDSIVLKKTNEFVNFKKVGAYTKAKTKERIIKIKLDIDIDGYINNTNIKIKSKREAKDTIRNDWEHKLKALKRCWNSYKSWKFYIELQSTKWDDYGTDPILCHIENE